MKTKNTKKNVKTTKPVVLKEYLIVNQFDGNDSFTIKAENAEDAAFKALFELGWAVAE